MDIGNLNAAYSDIYSSAASAKADQLRAQLEKQLQADPNGSTDEELMDACKQFEAYFLEQMFKEMMKTIPTDEGTSANSKLVDYFKDETVRSMAEQSTETNSLGLAQMLYEQMKRNLGVSPDSLS